MSSWKRGFLEIISDILDSILDGPLLKTHIISKSKIDSRTITKYLSTLELVGMVKKSNDRLLFEITQKGINIFLNFCNPLYALILLPSQTFLQNF